MIHILWQTLFGRIWDATFLTLGNAKNDSCWFQKRSISSYFIGIKLFDIYIGMFFASYGTV